MMSKDFEARQIIYEDNHLMVINKKAGQIVQGDKSNDIPLSELIKFSIKLMNDNSKKLDLLKYLVYFILECLFSYFRFYQGP